MKQIQKMAKTIEEAVKLGVQELEVAESQVKVEVIQQPTKGFLGIGSKQAIVNLTVVYSPEQVAEKFLQSVFETMNVEMSITSKTQQGNILVDLEGKNAGIIIGKRGETLDALQYLTNIVVRKEDESHNLKVILDVENYRAKREQALVQLANKIANQVKKTRKKVVLEPMNAYERKIIHSTLQNHPYVVTHSEGKDPYRKVIIATK